MTPRDGVGGEDHCHRERKQLQGGSYPSEANWGHELCTEV